MSKRLFSECEALAKVLQGKNVTAQGVFESVRILEQTIQRFRTNDNIISKLINLTERMSQDLDLEVLEKRRCVTPARIRHDDQVAVDEQRCPTEQWRSGFYEALDLVQAELSRRFNQNDLIIASNREQLILQQTSEIEMDEMIAKSNLPNTFDGMRLTLSWSERPKAPA